MTSIDSTESNQEVSTSPNSDKIESMFCKLNNNLTSFDSIHTDLLKNLAFYERKNKLLTEEKDKLYKEYTSLFESDKKEKSDLN